MYSTKFLVKAVFVLLFFLLPFVFFQNCSKLETSVPSKKNSSENPSDSQNDTISDDSQDSTGSIGLAVKVVSTNSLSRDCSLADSSYRYQIDQAGADILLCQEYTLDMPQGSSRRGEQNHCDEPNKFNPPGADWIYNTADRRWNKETQTRNHIYLVPGDYTLVVKDNQSKIFRSNILRIRHYGFSNCAAPSTSGNSAASVTCSWSGDDFSPAQPPQSVCAQNRINAKENGASGVEYTCVCTSSGGGTAITPGPVAGGATCNPAGTKLVRIATQLPDKSFPRTDYFPAANQIHVFSFKTPNTLAPVTHRLTGSTMGTTPSNINPVIIVSECPGDVSNNSQNRLGIGCSMTSAESAAISIAVNISPTQIKASSNRYCYLKPNTQYYANVFSQDSIPFLPTANCSNPHCGFSFQGN